MYKCSKFLICILGFGGFTLAWPNWPFIRGFLFTLVAHQSRTRDLKITKLSPAYVNVCHYTSVVMACIEKMLQMHKWKAFLANHLELYCMLMQLQVLKKLIAIVNHGLTYWILRVRYFKSQNKHLVEGLKWPLTPYLVYVCLLNRPNRTI